MQDPHLHGRQLVFTVLLTEYRAHKSLWLGGLALVVVAALCAPSFLEGAHPVTLLAGAFTLIALLYLQVLVLLRRAIKRRQHDLADTDQAAFEAGTASGLFFAALPALFIIIVCSTTLFLC